jgi:hypothetical protein
MGYGAFLAIGAHEREPYLRPLGYFAAVGLDRVVEILVRFDFGIC